MEVCERPHTGPREFAGSLRRVDEEAGLVVSTSVKSPITLVHWPKPAWEHEGLGLGNPGLPMTETICKEVISLPLSAETTPEHVEITVQAIREFFG